MHSHGDHGNEGCNVKHQGKENDRKIFKRRDGKELDDASEVSSVA